MYLKKILTLLFAIILKTSAFGQTDSHFDDNPIYGTVNDEDGFTNIRNKPNSNSTIVGKIYNYHIFSYEQGNGNWLKVLLNNDNNKSDLGWVEGYIYKGRIMPLRNWKTLNIQKQVF